MKLMNLLQKVQLKEWNDWFEDINIVYCKGRIIYTVHCAKQVTAQTVQGKL